MAFLSSIFVNRVHNFIRWCVIGWKVEKIMVTKKSSKKRDLEHYGLSDEIDVFFTFLPPVLKKGQK